MKDFEKYLIIKTDKEPTKIVLKETFISDFKDESSSTSTFDANNIDDNSKSKQLKDTVFNKDQIMNDTGPVSPSIAPSTFSNVENISLPISINDANQAMGPIISMTMLPKEGSDNWSEKDFIYNSYSDNRAQSFNMWTRSHDDNCSEENRLRVSTKPMKYFVNQYNSPQAAPFQEFSIIGNQKVYDVRNNYERAIPTRLNPIYPTMVEPYMTSPFLGQANDSRLYSDTGSTLRFGTTSKERNSTTAITEKDYNRFNPGVQEQIVQNAGQFNVGNIARIDDDGYYNYFSSNNLSLGNDAVPRTGISTRTLLSNILELSKC